MTIVRAISEKNLPPRLFATKTTRESSQSDWRNSLEVEPFSSGAYKRSTSMIMIDFISIQMYYQNMLCAEAH